MAPIDVPAIMLKVMLCSLPSLLSLSDSHSYNPLYAPASYAPKDPPPCNTKALSFLGIFVLFLSLLKIQYHHLRIRLNLIRCIIPLKYGQI